MTNAEKYEAAIKIIEELGIKVYTKDLRKEDEWKCLCPVHEETNPSCYINPKKFVYHCFACNASGSLAALYKEKTGKSIFKELNNKFDSFSAFYLKKRSANLLEQKNDYESPPSVSVDLQEGDLLELNRDPILIHYLRKRHLLKKVLLKSQVKWTKYAKINGTIFNHRLMIPIYENKKLLAYEGRSLTDEKPKVLYPAKTTTQTLFEFDRLNKEKPLYVVEGLTDLFVLRSYEKYENSTAIFGASVTKRQLYLLNQFQELILIPNEDMAGYKAIKTIIDNVNVRVKILKVPNHIKGVKVNDVADIPIKLRVSIKELTLSGWEKHAISVDDYLTSAG